MPTTILLPEQKIETVQCPKTLDEAVWNTWLNRNAAKERRNRAFRMETVRWGCIGLLLLAAGLSFQHAFVYPLVYTKVVQFALALGAIAFAWEAISSRRNTWAVAFISVAVLFNPVLPGSWLFRNSPVLLVSILPFILVAHWGNHETEVAASSSKVFHAE